MRISQYVNPEKRTCVVVISNFDEDVRRALKKAFKYSDDIRIIGELSYMNGEIKGIAKCAPDDTFDEERGLAIAEARAKRKYNTLFNRELGQFAHRILRRIADLQRDEDIDPSVHYPII